MVVVHIIVDPDRSNGWKSMDSQEVYQKGTSCNNAACEGFFRRMKNEIFYENGKGSLSKNSLPF